MNCIQAQAVLAAYRELRKDQADTTELDEHLEQCASCRSVLAQYTIVGDRLRSLPMIEPPPAAYTRLMNALAAEHIRYMQHANPVMHRPPEFLKPYLREHVQYREAADPLLAFSNADTGPLPIISMPHKQRRHSHFRQLAVIGLAAAFLIAVMMSGLTTLLVLSHGNPQRAVVASNLNSAVHPAEVSKVAYTISTPYVHVVSAVADSSSIYYTGYGDNDYAGWMLEEVDRSTQVSIPLLTQPSASPLIILGSSPDWLVWLQFDLPRATSNHPGLPMQDMHLPTRTWSLNYLSLTPTTQQDGVAPGVPITLASGTFDANSAPGWLYSPVQGIWFMQDTLLVASIDEHGVSKLLSYQLDATGSSKAKVKPVTLATAAPGHVLTSPTASSDGNEIYWADEWETADGGLHSNIWTQRISETPGLERGGVWTEHTIAVKELFRADGTSFDPKVVDDNLFFLSTAEAAITSATPGATATITPAASPTPTMQPAASVISWADPSFYAAPVDQSESGNLLMLSLNDPAAAPAVLNSAGHAWAPQVGASFVLWQSERGYQMFDVGTQSPINVGNVLDNAQFLAVNGNTAAWTVGNSTTSTTSDASNPSATFVVFNWPK